MSKQHISYSELKIFTECPYKWKLQYVDGLKGFTGNIYTAFGTAIHSVCEQSALGNLPDEEFATHFDEVFLEELKRYILLKKTSTSQYKSCNSHVTSRALLTSL